MMRIPSLAIIFAALFCTLGVLAQNNPATSLSWCYQDSLVLANGEGNLNPSRPVSFINDSLWHLDLNEPFSITARLRVSERRFWRAPISIESPSAPSALFRIALPPDSMRFNVAWMRGPQARSAINTNVDAPGPNVEFHFALVKDEDSLSIYVNGVRRTHQPFSSQIFNPDNKQIVLGRTKLDGRANRSQWNGLIRDVGIWRRALSAADVSRDRNGGTYCP